MVMLSPPGVSKIIESRRHVVNYMRANFDSWLEFANASYSWGLDLRPEDVIFVCGTLKTTQWALAAFQGSRFRDREGHVSGQLGSSGSIGISVQISNEVLSNGWFRSGPRVPAPSAHLLSYLDHDTLADSPPVEPNQCLFVHYYKMKRRFWYKKPMQAGAGQNQLPPGPDNPGPDAMSARRKTPPYEFEPNARGCDDVCAAVVPNERRC